MRRVALLMAVAVIAAACAGEPVVVPSAGPTTAASPSATASDTPAPSPTSTPSPSAAEPSPTTIALGDQRELGQGFVEAYSRDGSTLLVQIEEHQEGCEGAPTLALQRMDIDRGTLTEVAPDLGRPVGGTLMRTSGSDRVAIVDQCEGFLVEVLVGTEEADGRLRGLTDVGGALQQRDVAPWTLAWDHLGETMTVVGGVFAEPDQPRDLLRLDPATGEVTTIFSAPYFSGAEQISTNRYLLVRDQRLELVDGTGATVERYPQSDGAYARAPGGSALALASEDGMWILRDGRLTKVFDAVAWAPTWSPDGRLLTFLSTEDPRTYDVVHLWVVAADGRSDPINVSATASAGAGFGAGAVSPNAGQLAWTQVRFDADGFEVGEITLLDLVVG